MRPLTLALSPEERGKDEKSGCPELWI